MSDWTPLDYAKGAAAPPIISTAGYVSAAELNTYQTIEDFPERLAALDTMIIYIDPNNNVYHLNGPGAGREGVRLGEQLQGEQHIPFEQVLIESAFQIGTTIQRTNILKRLINFRVVIGNTRMSSYTYRMCEERWWAGQIEDKPGWLGVFTRYSGWRWTQVYPYKTTDTTLKQDPAAYGNNFAIWDVYWIAPVPYYAKPARYAKWNAWQSGQADSSGMYHGIIPLANAGDVKTYVNYVVSGSGYCQLQDNYNTAHTMVDLPKIFDSDGAVMVSTDPSVLTVMAENDPQDNQFYELTRSAGILNFLLAGIADQGEPIWQRKYTRFLYSIPPKTVAHLRVAHSNEHASITAIVPQRFRRSR